MLNFFNPWILFKMKVGGIIIFIFVLIFLLFCVSLFIRNLKEQDTKDKKQEIKRIKPRFIPIFDEQKAFGELGENEVANMLEKIKSNYDHVEVFNDFTFMDSEGYSANIDHILICTGGMFVIETKANKGKITKNREEWIAIKEDIIKTLKDPIKQNQGHINHLKKMLGNQAPKMISLVIFPEADNLNDVKNEWVYDLSSAYDYIVDKINKPTYSSNFVDKMAQKLTLIQCEYGITKEKHSQNITKIHHE